jgi:site-specific DNA-cytosine methylase
VYNAMRVLSLFDGMSCGQIALKEIGITPEVYYASEIDKFAIKQLGNGWTIKVIEHILKRIKES